MTEKRERCGDPSKLWRRISGACRRASRSCWQHKLLLLLVCSCLLALACLPLMVRFGDEVLPTGQLTAADYAELVTRTLDAAEVYWNRDLGYYESPIRTSSLTNSAYVQAVSILAGLGRAPRRHLQRAYGVLEKLVSYPVWQGASRGVSLDMGYPGTSHMSVSGPYCTALAYAYRNAEELGLPGDVRAQVADAIRSQAMWLRDQLDEPTGGANQLALRWLPEAAAALRTIGFHLDAASIAEECVQRFLGNSSTSGAGYARAWVNPDWTWVYNPLNARQSSVDVSGYGSTASRSEYTFTYLSHCAAGVHFLEEVLGVLPEEFAVTAAALLRRSLGHWGVSGYPLWMSTQLDHRMYSNNYWIWCFYSLAVMATWDGWSEPFRSVSRTVLDSAVRLFDEAFLQVPLAKRGAALAELYPVRRYESGSLNRHPDLTLTMAAAYIAMAIDLGACEVHSAETSATWGYEHVARNLYVSTSTYGVVSGNQVLKAYYEDRGDITSLYHGNGRLLSPAYVEETDAAAQWSVTVYEEPVVGNLVRVLLSTDQDRPEQVSVSVDGGVIPELDYCTELSSPGFSVIEKESCWNLSGANARMTLTFGRETILREFSFMAPEGHSGLGLRLVFPTRRNVRSVVLSQDLGRAIELSTTGSTSVRWSTLRYVSFDYGGYGYVIIPAKTAQDLGVAAVSLEVPTDWIWDRGRGPSAVVYLRGLRPGESEMVVSHLIGFTDGTLREAEETYRTLVRAVEE